PIAVLEEKVIPVGRAPQRLERDVDVLEGNLLGLGFLLIDFEEELRLRDAEAREQADQTRIAVPLVGQALHRALQRAEAGAATVLHLELEAAGGAEPLDRRGANDGHARFAELIIIELLAKPSGDRRGADLRL